MPQNPVGFTPPNPGPISTPTSPMPPQRPTTPTPEPEQITAPPAPPTPPSAESSTPPAPMAPQKNKSHLKTIIGVIILVLTVAGAAAGFFLSQNNQDVRQQATGITCESRGTPTTCNSVDGCSWKDPAPEKCSSYDAGSCPQNYCNVIDDPAASTPATCQGNQTVDNGSCTADLQKDNAKCNARKTEATCNELGDVCGWTPKITQVSCSTVPLDRCSATTGCRYVPNDKICSGPDFMNTLKGSCTGTPTAPADPPAQPPVAPPVQPPADPPAGDPNVCQNGQVKCDVNSPLFPNQCKTITRCDNHKCPNGDTNGDQQCTSADSGHQLITGSCNDQSACFGQYDYYAGEGYDPICYWEVYENQENCDGGDDGGGGGGTPLVVGNLDTVTCYVVEGWACDYEYSGKVDVHFYWQKKDSVNADGTPKLEFMGATKADASCSAGADCTGIAAQCHGDGNRRFSFNYNDMGGEQLALKQRIQSDEAGNVYTFIIDRDANGGLTNNNNPIAGSGKSKEIPCSGPVCLNISIDNPAPEFGQTVNLTCGLVPGITQYEFRIKTPDGSVKTLESTGNLATFSVDEIGQYIARCTICPNGQCQVSDFMPTFLNR